MTVFHEERSSPCFDDDCMCAQRGLFTQNIRNPFAGVSIAVGIAGVRHRRVSRRVIQQTRKLAVNRLFRRTDELERARRNALRALGRVAHDQNRLAQTRRFLLNTAGIGQNQRAVRHNIVEIQHIQRLDNVQTFQPGQFFRRFLPNNWIQVNRVERLDIGVLCQYAANRAEHMVHSFAKVLPPMRGDENQAAALRPRQFRVGVIRANGSFQRVDGGVARHEDRRFVFALAQQVLLCLFRRRK